jgi:hypothetical protein
MVHLITVDLVFIAKKRIGWRHLAHVSIGDDTDEFPLLDYRDRPDIASSQ